MRLIGLIAVIAMACLVECRADTYREVTVTRTQAVAAPVTVTQSYSQVQPVQVVQTAPVMRFRPVRSRMYYVPASQAVTQSVNQTAVSSVPTPASDIPTDSPPPFASSFQTQSYSSSPAYGTTVTRTTQKTKGGCQCGCGRKHCHCK